ncbi:MAG: 30S ribosomal protein S16 [Candidatus Brennerbacteria bacterium CG11_big_fil_rev_8_21_14_0_20_43_10]|uniref:30S ribosomal protein S16 n=1 Tax=Candidatus Brennerbacteria bacterium CG11_big_fil_rev_8_21_14_0_20_43_10 TaxID=1974523 RepID=A0A2H0PY55_9BACT|nr:MAG: 30S ribosomal protein S16 [Candidatus Brennerbacteria bacterium CG11_big_fil_rev_8_21_14_0_20_43_10]
MLTLRLQRTGRKHAPSFRVIATPKGKGGPKGKPIEYLGWMNPLLKQFSLNKERILYWISQGAQVSATLHNLLIKAGVITGKKIAKHHFVSQTPAPEASTASATQSAVSKVETLSATTQEASVVQPVTHAPVPLSGTVRGSAPWSPENKGVAGVNQRGSTSEITVQATESAPTESILERKAE